MDTNDFLGSFAQENVSFSTSIVKTTVVGDNYWKAMVFIENDRFVDTTDSAWVAAPGLPSIKCLSVSADDYATYTTGVLQSWLYDLFCNGFTGECILVACASHDAGTTGTVYSADGNAPYYSDAEMQIEVTLPEGAVLTPTGTEHEYTYTVAPSSANFNTEMEKAYEVLKPYAYHKTVCAAPTLATTATFVLDTTCAVKLATLCAVDKNLLSSAPYYPYTTGTPEDLTSDPIYSALKNAGNKDAFMAAHQDATRNAALYSLGIALGTMNGSGTPVGNSLDMVRSSNITCSGANGLNLSKGVRSILANAHIQSFKPVGNNSGEVAAIGAQTLNGDVVQATWVVAYITYMTKVNVAQLLTTNNFLKNANNYAKILNVMTTQLNKFGTSGSGRLTKIAITAPAFGNVDSGADEIVIPNAWEAYYVDQVRSVQITGTLYIGV